VSAISSSDRTWMTPHRSHSAADALTWLLRDGSQDTRSGFQGPVAELTCAVKSFFFRRLGYWTDVSHMADWQAWAVAGAVVCVIYPGRYAILRLLGRTTGALSR